MAARDRKFFQQGINTYVKAMAYSADLLDGQPTNYNLGTPTPSNATKFQTGVAANAAAGTVVSLSPVAIADSTYGRTLILTPSGDPGNSFQINVYGQDYAGQPMVEQFTGASGSTAVLYGRKAFFRILNSKVVTPSANAITYSVGTGTRLGLPFKGDLAYAYEASLLVPFWKRDTPYQFTVSAADATSGISVPMVPPFPGFVKNLFGSGTAAGAAGNNVLTCTIGGVAITGLSLNVPNNTAAYNTAAPGTPGYNANNRFLANTPVVVPVAALATAKEIVVGVTFTPTQFSLPDLTDPGTFTTGDPRGTYEPIMTMDGVSQINVGLMGDNTVNTTGNGGLLGIQHFFG